MRLGLPQAVHALLGPEEPSQELVAMMGGSKAPTTSSGSLATA